MSCVLRSGGPGRPDPQGPPEGLPPQGPPKVPPQVRRRSTATWSAAGSAAGSCERTQVGIALKCHNSAQSSPFESKLGCPRASGRCPRRWYHSPAQTHKAGRRRARYIRRTSHRTYPDTSVNRPYLTLTEADSDALWSSVTTGPRRFVSSTAWPIHTLLSCSKLSI